MPIKVNITLSMIIDKETQVQSIEELCEELKCSLDQARKKELKDFKLDIKIESLEEEIIEPNNQKFNTYTVPCFKEGEKV